jgi:hypothetical protein|tara:strand:- start:3188 stop:4813 length:1626 start_codon:yes stop_codon:yes gene_type:complete
MKTNIYILTLLSLFFIVSCKDDDSTGTIDIIDPVDPVDPVFVYVDPNINDGVIDFEEFGPSFEQDTAEDAERSNGGNWSQFGGTDEAKISIEYADNPDKSEPNTSDKVLKVTEPELTNEWAGFYFKLEEGMNFPDGKEAIKVDIWSPAGTQVSIKLEDELANGSDGKKDTGDIFATKQQDGWESLVFNIPDGKLENGVYNTFVIIMTRFETAAGVSYLDNIDFSTPAEVIIPDAPTTAPAAPTYDSEGVISIFSDAYTSPEGINLNPSWDQATEVTEEVIADNTVLLYDNLNYQGTEITPALDVSSKTKIHIDFFTGNASGLQFFLISPDGDDADDAAEEKAYDLDVTTSPGEWNSVDIDLSHFSDVVDLSEVFQLKVVGNGTVYFDNIFFYGGGAQSGSNYSADYSGTFDGSVYDADNGTFEFPSSAQSWAGFANQAEIYPLAFPNGGKITFNAATTGAEDIVVKFKFERLTYNAEGNGAADTEPSFETATATVSGTESSEYVVDIAPRPATETYSSALLYLITQDQVLTASDFVITSYD